MRFALAGIIVLAGLTAAGLLWVAGAEDEDPQVIVVDERAGRLRGVAFGETAEEVRARLGAPTDEADGFFPEGADFTGPPAIPSPRSDQGSRVPPEELHYDDTAYLVSPTVGVYSMAMLARGARTRAGIGVGDDLEEVRKRYDRVDCGNAIAGEPLFGSDYPTYPWCRAIVGEVRVFFGADPIESVTLTRLAGTPRGRPRRLSPRRRTRRRERVRLPRSAPARGRR
jgi:hypothetical protein